MACPARPASTDKCHVTQQQEGVCESVSVGGGDVIHRYIWVEHRVENATTAEVYAVRN